MLRPNLRAWCWWTYSRAAFMTGSRPPAFGAVSVVDAFTAGVAELDVIHDRAVDEFEELNSIVGFAVSKARCMASRTSATCRESSSGGRPPGVVGSAGPAATGP